MTIPIRLIYLPVAFDDSQTRAAVERYVNTIRKDAPNTEGGNNIDYIVRCNGLGDREELYESVLATEHWSAFIGFFPGLPFMFPLDPRHAVVAPKYNPTRTWTPEGAARARAARAGRSTRSSRRAATSSSAARSRSTISPQRNEAFRENPLLMRAGDRVAFHRIEEDELLSLFEDVRADRYRYRVEEGAFDVGAFIAFREAIADETAERRAVRERAAAETPVP